MGERAASDKKGYNSDNDNENNNNKWCESEKKIYNIYDIQFHVVVI
jgi:hypothetical protein